jgi:hypothetical protein
MQRQWQQADQWLLVRAAAVGGWRRMATCVQDRLPHTTKLGLQAGSRFFANMAAAENGSAFAAFFMIIVNRFC